MLPGAKAPTPLLGTATLCPPPVVACEFWPDLSRKACGRPGLQALLGRPRPSSSIRGLQRPVLTLQAAARHGLLPPRPLRATRSYFTPPASAYLPFAPPTAPPHSASFLLSASVSHMPPSKAQPHLQALGGATQRISSRFLSSWVHLLTPMDVLGYIYILGAFRMVQLQACVFSSQGKRHSIASSITCFLTRHRVYRDRLLGPGGSVAHTCAAPCLVAQLCPTLCDPVVAHQAPLSKELSRQDYQSGLPCPAPGDLPNQNRTGVSCIAGRFFTS